MTRKRLIAGLALGLAGGPIFLAYGSAAAARATSKASVKASRPTRAEVAAGKTLFEENCAVCHGIHGEGTAIGPGFSSFKRAQSITGVIEQLTKPLEPKTGTKMPEKFDKQLSAKQKEDLGAYVTVELTKTVRVVK